MRQDLVFESSGLKCAAWLYPGAGEGRRPVVVMGHGLGATRELGLAPFAERFQAAGLSALVFDYRHYGASEGEPRELLSVGRQLDDWRAAIAFAKTLPDVDPGRVAIWGSSFGGGHVMTIASEGHGVAAAISQVPFSSGLASGLRIPPLTVARITGRAIVDLVRSAFGASPSYIGLLGSPGDVALMTAPDCQDGYGQLVTPEVAGSGRWHNRVTARTGLAVTLYEPRRRASKIEIPWLVVVAEKDSIAPAAPTVRASRAAPRAELLSYPGGHFDYYVGEGFERIVGDELDFLRRHLLEGR